MLSNVKNTPKRNETNDDMLHFDQNVCKNRQMPTITPLQVINTDAFASNFLNSNTLTYGCLAFQHSHSINNIDYSRI